MVLISLNDWSNLVDFDLRAISLRKITFDNYRLLIIGKALFRLYFNTALMTAIVSVVGAMFTVVGGYGMLRASAKMRTIAIVIIAFAVAVPSTVVIIPLFIEMYYLGLSGLPAVMLKGMLVSSGVIVAWQYFKRVPQGYFDSATIDGANSLQIIWHILIPISGPLFAMTMIGQGTAFLGDYLWLSLNLIRENSQTVIVAMTNMTITSNFNIGVLGFAGKNMRRVNIEMASGIVIFLPMLLIFLAGRKKLMDFKLEGGIKE